ncbi:hypothetical protein SAMN04490244_101551 [Tranquillimonas rosea]|uniref:Uncharacterized protein n=1 Tax=Tranquillimonas rosea TaxID=641238 RepID=A0A1H9QB49_9RHOB|nr:hypothetical protein [Tranquillimonas rosea]SER57756.1 hypothetical protein SAMN04490244_101551 [Tranquillimonas rosea]
MRYLLIDGSPGSLTTRIASYAFSLLTARFCPVARLPVTALHLLGPEGIRAAIIVVVPDLLRRRDLSSALGRWGSVPFFVLAVGQAVPPDEREVGRLLGKVAEAIGQLPVAAAALHGLDVAWSSPVPEHGNLSVPEVISERPHAGQGLDQLLAGWAEGVQRSSRQFAGGDA